MPPRTYGTYLAMDYSTPWNRPYGGEINFTDMVSRSAEKIIDLDNEPKPIEFEEKHREDVNFDFSRSCLKARDAENKAANMFGLSVKNTRMMFLPCWEFTISEKKTDSKTTLLLDAATGSKVNLQEKTGE